MTQLSLKWVLLFTALTVFFTACSSTGVVEGVETVTVTLTAEPAQVDAAGGEVTFVATLEGEEAVAVDFAEKDAATALATDSTPEDGYSTVTSVTPPKTYLALAKNAEGATIGTSNEVTVTAIGTEPAPNPTPPTPGPTPPGPTDPGPTDPGPTPVPGGPIPADAVLAASIQEVNAAPAGATIVLTQNLSCTEVLNADPCIVLKENQKLLGGKDGLLLTTPGVKITTSIAAGIPGNSTDTAKVTVVRMANGTSVEGIDFDGDDIYQAINAPVEVTGAVTVRNVSISTPTANNPIEMKSVGAVTLENLSFTTTRSMLLEGFSSATIKGLKLTMARAATSTGAALTLVSSQATSTVVLEALDLTTNLGGTNKDGVLIQSGVLPADAGAMTVTVKDSKVTFPDADLATSIAFNFNVVGTGTLTIQTPESIGNTTNATYAYKATYDTGVTGTIALP
jgi:hypothetical protein